MPTGVRPRVNPAYRRPKPNVRMDRKVKLDAAMFKRVLEHAVKQGEKFNYGEQKAIGDFAFLLLQAFS